MFNKLIRVLGWALILGGICTLLLVADSIVKGEVEVSSRRFGNSVVTVVTSPQAFYGFVLAYAGTGVLMIALAYYILSNKGSKD